MKRLQWKPLAVAAALWGLCLAVESPMSAAAARSGWMEARQVAGSPAAAQLAGAFRVVAANVLWLKVDAYHHESQERGVGWTDDKDLLPILRAITYLDPHFVEAYHTHSIMLTAQGRLAESRALLQEGVRNNPGSPEMHVALGLLYGRHLNRLDLARNCFVDAYAVTKDEDEKFRISRTIRNIDQRLAAGKG